MERKGLYKKSTQTLLNANCRYKTGLSRLKSLSFWALFAFALLLYALVATLWLLVLETYGHGWKKSFSESSLFIWAFVVSFGVPTTISKVTPAYSDSFYSKTDSFVFGMDAIETFAINYVTGKKGNYGTTKSKDEDWFRKEQKLLTDWLNVLNVQLVSLFVSDPMTSNQLRTFEDQKFEEFSSEVKNEIAIHCPQSDLTKFRRSVSKVEVHLKKLVKNGYLMDLDGLARLSGICNSIADSLEQRRAKQSFQIHRYANWGCVVVLGLLVPAVIWPVVGYLLILVYPVLMIYITSSLLITVWMGEPFAGFKGENMYPYEARYEENKALIEEMKSSPAIV